MAIGIRERVQVVEEFFRIGGQPPQVVDQIITGILERGSLEERERLGRALKSVDDFPGSWQSRGLRSLQGREFPGFLADYYHIEQDQVVAEAYRR